MKILFLLSSLEPAGSETYCVALAEAWGNHHEIFWISDKLHWGQTYLSLPIHRKAIPMGLVNTWRVASFIRTHGIQLIHSHSRRAHWVAAQAARITGIAHVTTFHQPPPVHFFSKLFPCLGRQTIAIDEVVAARLRQFFGCPASQLHLIRNGLNLSAVLPSVRQVPNLRQILLIGRLSGGRWRVLQFFLEVLEKTAPTLPPAHYKIVGRIPDERREALNDQLSIVGSKIAPSTVTLLGHVQDLSALVRNSDAAIAAGRSALECLAQGRPVVLLGEGGILGLCRPEIWTSALQTNLGDHLEPRNFDPAKLAGALRAVSGSAEDLFKLTAWGRSQVEKDFDIRTVAARVDAVYRQALA